MDLIDGGDFEAADDPQEFVDVACAGEKSGRRRHQPPATTAPNKRRNVATGRDVPDPD
jgi:hypothetical protein